MFFSKAPLTGQKITDQRIKSYAKWKKAWHKVPVQDITSPGPTTQALLKHIEENGAAEPIFKQYKIGPAGWPNPDNIDIDKFHPHLHCYDLFNRPETDPSLTPDNINDKNHQFIDPWDASKSLGMKTIDDYAFIAELAAAINAGGAYGPSYAIGEQALETAIACYKEWMGVYQFNQVEALINFYHLGQEWTSWFIDEWIDYAWVSYNFNTGIVTVLMISDTD